jgi:hypothetical protein
MHNYKLKYLSIEGDMAQKSFDSPRELEVGEVIELESGFWHCITDIRNLNTGVQLVLAESAQSARDAVLLARQRLDD